MKKYAVETTVGIFLVFGLLCVGYMTVKLGHVSLLGDNAYPLFARFSTVSGLRVGSPIHRACRAETRNRARRPRAGPAAPPGVELPQAMHHGGIELGGVLAQPGYEAGRVSDAQPRPGPRPTPWAWPSSQGASGRSCVTMRSVISVWR